jgi:membrane fusion protein
VVQEKSLFAMRDHVSEQSDYSMSLFRPEVFESKKLQAFGRTVPLYASNTLPIVVLLVVLMLFLGIWLVNGRFSRTEMVEGWVVPNGPMSRIIPAQSGTLVDLRVREGQQVQQGEPLATIETQSATTASADPGADSMNIVNRQRQLIDDQSKLAAQASSSDALRLRQSVKQMQSRMATMTRQIALQKARVASAQRSFAILNDAASKKYISKIDFESQRRAYLAEKAQLEQFIAEQAALRTQYNDALAELRQLPIKLGERLSELRSSRVSLDQQQLDVERQRSYVLKAPIDGVVAAMQSKLGQSVQPQMPMMYVLGNGAQMEVELYAPSRSVGFAKVGQEVRLMYDSFPYQQFGSFGGTIYDISRTALAPTEVDAPLKLQESAYRIRIKLSEQAIRAFGREYPVQPGMTLKANVILERQSFFDWLLEPINAVRNRT